jgi:5-methyltetrahydrofolate--homocysteine methyltransferase
MDPLIQSIQENVINGQKAAVESLVREALAAKLPPDEILNTGLIAAMKEVGARFEAGDFYVPEMLIAARAMQAGLAILKPYLAEGGVQSAGKVVIGTVKGDLHDIGKNLVSMMLEGAGFEIVDLGTDVPPEKFIAAIKDNNAGLLGMSALLTTT